jgi:hypothetical protein
MPRSNEIVAPREAERRSARGGKATKDVAAAPQLEALEAPRFAAGWAALVYAVATFSLAYPAFAGLFLVNPRSDQYIAGYAFREFAAQSLRSGHGFPQWNPYLFGGLPYIAAMHGDIFYPTFLLRMLMPTDAAMTWGFIIHLFLAGFFTYRFLRAWGVGFYGALIGGLAYMLSGPIAAYASPGHDGKLFVSTLLPLALWMLVRLIRDARPWAFGVFALTVGLAVLSPHPQLLQYLLLTSGAFALYIVFAGHGGAERAGKLTRDVALRRLGLALGAVILGMLMGAVQYLPVREYVPWSPRAAGMGWEHAISYSMPIEELFNVVVPQFSGMFDNYWGRNGNLLGRGIHLHSEYAGVVVLVLATAGMFASAFRRSFRWFWIGAFVVSLLWALGGSTPFFRIIYAIVPGTKFFRAPSTMMYVSMFSLAVLAGLGTERVINAAAAMPKRFLWIWAAAILFIGVILAAGLPGIIAEGQAARMSAAGYPTAQVALVTDLASRNQPNVLIGSLRSIVFVLLVLGLIWSTAANNVSRRTAAWVLAILVAADLWSVEHNYWIFSPPAKKLFASDAAIDAMRASADPGRVVAWDPLDAVEFRDPAFEGDAFMVHRLRSVTGYHGNEVGRYQQLLAAQNLLTPQFWRHENVHFLYTTIPDSLMPQVQAQLHWPSAPTKLIGPVRNAVGSTVYLYKLPGVNPAAWVASAVVKGTDEQALATALDVRFDPERAAIVDTAGAIPTAEPSSVPAPSGVQAKVTRYEPGVINVQLDKSVAPGTALVVSENFFPGWRASANGQNAAVTRANFNLIGVALPAGAREVQLRFIDSAYETGKIITLIAIALSLVATIGGVLLDRRRLATAP